MYFGRPRLTTRQLLREAKLARLKEAAPGLGMTRSYNRFAMFAAVIAVMAVAGFYYTVRIYQATLDQRHHEYSMITVDRVEDVGPNRVEATLLQIEASEMEADASFEELIGELLNTDLLGDDVPRIPLPEH